MNMILAADRNWGIGNKGQLLCHLSGDLKYFKQTTLGHTVIMGRATLESLPGKRGLPGRRNIVLTSRQDFTAERVDTVCHNLEELRAAVKDDPDAFVIGGAEVYEQLLPWCDTVYITKIDAEFPADRRFRNLDMDPAFQITRQSVEMEENGIRYRFVKYERKEN